MKGSIANRTQLRATLPVSIFISPNMPLDEQGNLVDQSPTAPAEQNLGTIAPPGYGEHVLDQLYEDVETHGFQTPGVQSGVNSPFYAQSRSGSTENLAAALTHSRPVAPAALSSRLADVSLDPSRRNTSYTSIHSVSGFTSPVAAPHGGAPRSEPQSGALTRSNSAGDDSSRNSSEHVDLDPNELTELSKVPSYQTAVRTPARSISHSGNAQLPDYQTALSAPRTPPATDILPDLLGTISEDQGEDHVHQVHHVSRPSSLMAGRSYTEDNSIHQRMQMTQDQVC